MTTAKSVGVIYWSINFVLILLLNIFDFKTLTFMRKAAIIVMAVGILALGACASSKPCPAYAKALDSKEIKG